MKVRFAREHVGRHQEGDLLDLPAHEAEPLILAGIAEPHSEDPSQEEREAPIEKAVAPPRERAVSRRSR